MWKMIIGNAVFQLIACFILLYLGPQLFKLDVSDPHQRLVCRTVVFNTFTWMQLFNQINSRVIDNSLNIFRRIHKHKSFVLVMLFEILGQIIVVEWAGPTFQTTGLDGAQWAACIIIGALSLPISFVIRLLPDCQRAQAQVEQPRVTIEKLRWESAIHDVRAQIRVVNALRRSRHI